jgi:hypothetical protein
MPLFDRGPKPLGTKVQYRNGYIKVKCEDNEGKAYWEAESRRIWEMQRGELAEGDRIYHIDGDRTNNRIGNLAKVHFNSTKFVFLKQSRVLYMPSSRHKSKEIVYHESVKEFDRRTAVASAGRRR